MADIERLQLDLARAQRHLEAAEMGALLTQRTIAQLEAHGQPTADALRTLERLRSVIETMNGYRRSVLRSVQDPQTARSLLTDAPCRNPIPAPSLSPAAAGRPS